MKNEIEVKWGVFDFLSDDNNGNNNTVWNELTVYEPVPLLKSFLSERNKNNLYFKCPAVLDVLTSYYVIRAPYDLTFSIEKTAKGKSVVTFNYDQEFYDKHINNRPFDTLDNKLLTIGRPTYFCANESVVLTVMPAFLHKSKFLNNINLIPGEFDISKWFRPCDFTFEVIDDTQELSFKRGDPLYYIKFNTTKKIKFTRMEITPDLIKSTFAFVNLKNIISGNTMEKNYEIAKEYVKVVKNKIFGKKSKCPFHF